MLTSLPAKEGSLKRADEKNKLARITWVEPAKAVLQ